MTRMSALCDATGWNRVGGTSFRGALRRGSLLGMLSAAMVLVSPGPGAPLEATPPPPTFPTEVELITVDAVVLDAQGKPVRGLTRDDFQVLDEGQPQQVVSFEAFVQDAPASGPPEPYAPPLVATNASAANEGAAKKQGRVFGVLVDDLFLSAPMSAEARKAVRAFLERSLGDGDEVTLGTSSGEVWWSGRVPESRADLLAVLNRVKGHAVDAVLSPDRMNDYEAFAIANREALDGPITYRVVQRWLDDQLCLRRQNSVVVGASSSALDGIGACASRVRSRAAELDTQRRERTRVTLEAVRRAVEALSPGRGRKSLLLFSLGFLEDSFTDLRNLAAAAREANVAVYFLDLNGLRALSSGFSAVQAGSPPRVSDLTATSVEETQFSIAGSWNLADETGGFAVRNTNDLGTGAERVAAESRVFYLLGFHPPAGKPAKGWHKIEVRVTQPGVTVRARRGYTLTPSAKASRDPHELASQAALRDDAGIPLRLASYVLEPAADGKTRVEVVTEIDVAEAGSREREGRRVSQLALRLVALARDGGKLVARDVSLEVEAPATAGASSTPSWRPARLEFALPSGVYRVRAAVRDTLSKKAGAVTQRLVVPDPSEFHLSTPVLSDHLGSDGKGPRPLAHQRFQSAADRSLLCQFDVFGATRDQATGRPKVTVSFVLQHEDQRILGQSSPTGMVPTADGRLSQVIALPLGQLTNGEYHLGLTVEDQVAKKSLDFSAVFVVEGGADRPAGPPEPEIQASPPAPASSDLGSVLELAGRYVVQYQESFGNMLADETYHQEYRHGDRGPQARDTRAEVLVMTLPGVIPWSTFRDVYEVDGKALRDRKKRLERLFRESPATAPERAKAWLQESARYNLGPIQRTVNAPTVAMLFLHPANQHRFSFESRGERTIGGLPVVEVGFREQARPTVVRDAHDNDVPTQGRFLLDPVSGTVLGTEVEYDLDPRDPEHREIGRVVTEFRFDPKLKVFLPIEMRERYEVPLEAVVAHGSPFDRAEAAGANSGLALVSPGVTEQAIGTGGETGARKAVIQTTARYGAFRRFGVTTEEAYLPSTPDAGHPD
jgi:VWFA-related protein